MSSCLFCRIVRQEVPAHLIEGNEHAIVIKDIHPKAEIHWLVIPRMHNEDLRSFHDHDTQLLGHLMQTARHAILKHAGNKAFKCIINNGQEAGQRIFHTHLHLLAGKLHDDWGCL